MREFYRQLAELDGFAELRLALAVGLLGALLGFGIGLVVG